MSEIAIRAENLGKQYHIGALQQAGSSYNYRSLRDAISDAALAPFRAVRKLSGGKAFEKTSKDESIWALRNVSFEVKRGEIVGVIGRNGAGKSTLLKVMSRITEPTVGRAEIHGRVGSLLEVGTGFHPELTGRDNVFLNGAILGMKRAEIARQFDQIVSFAEVEKFIDTPVKHYSSGMYLRLAFAVAAHLEPEILIVDEVLAVGDADFQKKCLGKIQDVSEGGRTVVFVSHHLPSVQRLCTRAILLKGGQVEVAGDVGTILDHYLAGSQPVVKENRQVELSDGECRIKSWSVLTESDSVGYSLISRQNVRFKVRIESRRKISSASVGFVVRSLLGDLLVSANSMDCSKEPLDIKEGITDLIIAARLPLKVGRYRVELAIADVDFQIIDHWVAEPLLSVLRFDESVLSTAWQGLINEPVHFEVIP